MLCWIIHLPAKNAFARLIYMAKQSQQLVLMLIIGILIGTAGVMAWKTRSVTGEDETMNTTDSGWVTATDTLTKTQETIAKAASTLPLAPSIPRGSRIGLSVDDQAAGAVVAVSNLDIKDINWVAVYDDREGQPGYIMGATRVHAGDVTTSVELLRPTIKGEKYYVGVLGDDGSETFNRQTDLPPLAPDKVVIVSFVAL